ncbi:microtubule-associated protein futsch [Drosophila bipectinata]|uniref:microtubule-associated protein futsch n=1 Tax=Drosophila bipectinata TaxID=42026 RepID=UPI001C89352C|nr:uncharacterized protein LOC108126888 [Drosophila bipectinata]
MAASEGPTNPIQTEAISEECKDDDAMTSTHHTCANDPDFAVICAFLQKFAKDLGLNLPNFKHLQDWLTNNDEVTELKDLHIKLLRKTRKTVHEKSWESALSKFCFGYSVQDAWEVERFGYKNSSLRVKLRILRELLESQFERNAKFRAHILTLNANTLRSEPIGRDRLGHTYWLTQDADCNLRIYQEHLDEEIWQVVATNREEFVNLIARLRGNEVVLPSKDIGEADEDTSSSNSCPDKPPPPEEKEEEEDDENDKEPEEPPVKAIPNLKIKLRSPEQEEQKTKKVKPLLISQAKLSGTASPAQVKKRSVEEVDSSPTASQEQHQLKKYRPTLLDAKRINKPSRYESSKIENEGESGEEEEDDDSELDEAEEEEEEDIDSAAADIEEDDDDDEEIGEAIEEPTMVVKGQGSGRDCDAVPTNQICELPFQFECEELLFSEVVEDPVMHVIGQGSGHDCLVGNGKNDAAEGETTTEQSEPKATFFFGEPGCLKLSPIKQTSKPETKRSIFDSLSEEKTNGESEKPKEESLPANDTRPTTISKESLPTPAPSHKSSEAPEKETNSKEILKEEEVPAANEVPRDYKIKVIETSSASTKPEVKEAAPETTAPSKSAADAEHKAEERDVLPRPDESLRDADSKHTEEAPIKNSLALKTDHELPPDQKRTRTDVESERSSSNDDGSVNNLPAPTREPSQTKSNTSLEETIPTPPEIQEDAKVVPDESVTQKGPTPEQTNQILEGNTGDKTIKKSNASPDIEKISDQVQNELPNTVKSLVSKENGSGDVEGSDAKPKPNDDSVPKPPSPAAASKDCLQSRNRKRRLNECDRNLRNSTSESEVLEDEHKQAQEEEANQDDLDVGGKRIKMRPKITNVESRRKVEAQKTQIEETTSSSGEEDPRSRHKIAAPKRNLEKSPPTKQKPTLAEIIEKKLKKTPEKEPSEVSSIRGGAETTPLKEATPPPTSFSPPKKSPVTKPLKKNLLTQLRQEESDEEPVPRKRTNSETTVPLIPTPSTSLGKSEECYRKRRSSDEAKDSASKESSPSDVTASVANEKLKRNEEKSVDKAEDPQELASKESSPPAKETSVPPEGSARRSGRRGGAAVVYSELPQPKRTRGGSKEKPPPEDKAKEESEEEDHPEKSPPKTMLKSKSEIKRKSSGEEPAKKSPVKEEAIKEEDDKEDPIKEEDVKEDSIKEEPIKEETSKEEPIKEDAKEEPKPKVGRGRGPRKKREVDTTNIIEANDSETPVRQSRRIAQQKIKEEAERRKLEEVALRSMKQELKKKKKAEKEADPTVLEPSGEESESEASEAEEEARSKKKKKCPGKDGWSSDSEEQPESEEEEEEPPHYETDPGSPLFRSDHEFSPESELEDESQVVPMKRARTVRKENADDQSDDAEEACQKCGKSDHPEWILLCDTPACNKGYHCSCLSPVLFYIPEGDWHCPPCQQEQLIAALERQLQQFDSMVAQKEQERLLAEEQAERERQAQEASTKAAEDDDSREEDEDNEDEEEVKKASKADKVKRRRGDGRSNRRAAKRGTRRRRGNDSDSSNGKYESSGSGSRSGTGKRSGSSSGSSSSYSDSDDEPIYKLRKRRQINVSYRLNEYDDLINSALKKEMDEVAGAGNLGRGKDISTIIEADKEKARKEETSSDEKKPEKEGDESDKPKEKASDDGASSSEDEILVQRNKVKQPPAKKKSRKLTTLDVSSEEDNGSDEDFKTSSYSDEDTSQSGSGDSDSSLEVYRRPGRGKKQRKAARRAARERRKDRKFVVEGSDESEEEEPQRSTKSKKKKKEDSDYTETETEDDENGSDLSENVDSADLCDDTTSDSDDGAWRPSSKRKKASGAKKSNAGGIARKSPKLKKPFAQTAKKAKRLEYSDDDISESEPEDDDDDGEEDAPLSGKGSGKQPRSQPLKPTGAAAPSGKGKSKPKPKKKKPPSSNDEEEGAASDDRTRTRGRRYAYIEEDDDSSDGGIKPGVHRPDTPPEERQKFIQRQEEIKRMLAEKNAEGAKLAATPRLTPIKGASGPGGAEKRTPVKAAGGGDSLSTVPLSVIRQAKVLDIDYLQRKGETIGDLEDVDESELDDAELPDDLPEDMEDAIARMVEEEEQFSAAVAARELPGAEEVLRTTPSKAKQASKSAPEAAPAAPVPAHPPAPAPSASGLQEPMRKRLPMPTMHPPLLRHAFPHSGGQGPPHSLLPPQSMHGMHPMLQRHLSQAVPPPQTMQLLQNALSAPLGQPISRGNYPPAPPSSQHLPLVMSMPSAAAAAAHIMQSVAASAAARPPDAPAGNASSDSKPRGRRKKVTPLRDQLQKQQAAAAMTAATSSVAPGTGSVPAPKSKGQPLNASAPTTEAPVIPRMPPHLPPHHGRPHGHGPPAGMFPTTTDLARFYGQPPIPPTAGSRSPSSSPGPPRHLLRPPMPPGLPPSHSTLRPTYGPPPPLRGSVPPTSTASVGSQNPRAPFLHGAEHHGGPPGPSMAAAYASGPPPARHASPHLNPYRPPPTIYGNPNFPPRVNGPPGVGSLRPGSVDYAAGPRAYPPYGYYPPPPPLTTTSAHAAPSSVIVSAPPSSTPTNHSVSALTRDKSPAAGPPTQPPAPSPEVAAAPTIPVEGSSLKPTSVITSKKLTTLEAYTIQKSPMAVVGATNSPAPIAEEDSGSPREAGALPPGPGAPAVGEFSGLVSYFSSQQDDYDT